MKREKELSLLTNFFKNALINEEVSRTEVENFLRTYLEYIFKLNNVDISQYDITIQHHQIDEYHPKREKKFKNQPNKEDRLLDKRKALTKPSFKSNSEKYLFDALMYPSQTVENKYTIAINKNLCHAKNFGEIERLIFLFFVFGHEVHHIIQYIKHRDEMAEYDFSQMIHDSYLKSNNPNLTARENRKFKRAVNQHLGIIYHACSSEKYADKKGYDYIDILFNEIIKTTQDKDPKLTRFIETLQEYVLDLYTDRVYENEFLEQKLEEINQRISQYVDNEDLFYMF